MADNRATKSGFAAEAKDKIDAKYDRELASQVLNWINQVSGQNVPTDGSRENFHTVLKDGVVLCNLANALQPGACKIRQSKMPFVQMENVNAFLVFVDTVGINKSESFMTVDLFEDQDPNSVLVCLSALARKGAKFNKPSLGPKEAAGDRRSWTDEQLKAGQGIIGLQMGSNKGATAAGMNMGKTRHIVD